MISLAEWRAAGRTLRYRGHEVFTREAGPRDAPALLLIHGFPTASWDWEAVWEPLARANRVLTLDMMGFGLSAKPTAYAYSIADQANLLEHFLRDRGAERYHVLAHDYGDTVAQELLARQRGDRTPRMESLCLLNGGLFPETHRPVLLQKLLLSPVGPLVARLTSRGRFDANMRRIFGDATPPSTATLDGFWELLNHADGLAVMPKLIRYMEERREHRARWVGALTSCEIPLKLIDGPVDPVSGLHMVERYRELVPHPDVTLLDGVGHYPQVEAPEAVLAAYLELRARGTPRP